MVGLLLHRAERPGLAVPCRRPLRSWPGQQPGEPAGKRLWSRSQVGVQRSSIFPTGCGCSRSLSAFPAALSHAELRVMWMEGEELVGHAGGAASFVLQQLMSGLKVQISSFSPLCLHVSKQLNYTWIIFPTFCSQLCDLVACFYRKDESFMSLGESGRSFWKKSQVLNRVCQSFGE